MPEHARHLYAGLERAVAGHDVVKAHAAGIDLDHHLARTGDGIGNGLDAHRLDTARLLHHDCFHKGANFTSVTLGVIGSKRAFTLSPARGVAPTRLLNSRTPSSSLTCTTS